MRTVVVAGILGLAVALAPSATASTSGDAAFVKALDADGIAVVVGPGPSVNYTAAGLGEWYCTLVKIDPAWSMHDLGAWASAHGTHSNNLQPLTATQGEYAAGAAIAIYCPQYTYRVDTTEANLGSFMATMDLRS
jgi:hypothetical protein